jgi:hypothetical protein
MKALLALTLFGVTSPALGKDKKKDDTEQKKPDEESKKDSEKKDEKQGQTGASLSASMADDAAEVDADGPGNTIVFFDGGIRSGLGTLLQRDVIGRFEEEENTDVKSLGPMFHAGLLTKLFWKFRIGVGVGYGFNYTLKERLTKTEREQLGENEEVPSWVLGQLHTVDARLEFSQRLGDGFWLVATPRGGLSMIAVGEDLKAETAQYEDSHVVRQGPRLGVLMGGDIGFRYMLRQWFSFRITGGYSYTLQGLLKANRRGDAADSDHVWRTSMARFGSNLALEASF